MQRMRQFYERFVVPNPARTMDERMAVYNRLKGDLGTLSILSAEAVEEDRVSRHTGSCRSASRWAAGEVTLTTTRVVRCSPDTSPDPAPYVI